MKTKLPNPLATALLVLLAPFLMTTSVLAGTITVVNLPTNSTDIATGITTNKTYVCAFNYGSLNTTTYSVNGVPFAHFRTASQNAYLVTNWIDTNPGHGGQVIVSTGVTNKGVDVTSNASQGGLGNQADGNMQSLLTDLIYSGNGAPIGGWLQQEYDNLTIGHQYSLRLYYRYWGNSIGDRTQNIFFNGEGTWQAYPGNPLDEDAGTNGVLPNGSICHGARFIEYDFTASATNVFCLASNLVANGATMVEAATLEDDSYPYAPFITYQAQAAGIGNGIYTFSAQAIGTPSLAYQWYYNTVSNYSGATMATDDGINYSGSTTTKLTATNNVLDYYFVVVTNNYGSVTSSITAINPKPNVITQPSATNVANTYILYSMTAGGFLPLAYQWYFNTVSNYSGATMTTDGNGYSGSLSNTLVATTNLQDYYFVIVTNNYGSTTSAITAYNPRPTIVAQPAPFKVGSAVRFSAAASGWPILGYQWYLNTASNYTGATVMTDGNGVSGSSTASVTITNLLDYYFVVVTNYYGSVTSQVAEVAGQLTVASAGLPIWNQTSQTNVVVIFSDRLDPATATTAGNYLLNNSASVLSAVVGGSNEVVLTTSVLSPMTSYTLTVQDVNDYFGITMSPTATNVAVGIYPANLALWVRADTGVTADGSGNVSQWNDMSANGNNLTQMSGPPYEPQLATNDYGDPVIRFTATNETYMIADDVPSLRITGDMSIIAVMNFATLSGGTNGEIVSKTGAVPNDNIAGPYDFYVVGNTGNGARLYRGNGGNSGNGVSYGQFTATTVPTTGAPHILAVSETGNTVSHYLDGAAAGTGILSGGYNETNNADKAQPLSIGAREDFVNFLTGDMSELIVAGSAISSYDIAQLDNYFIAQHHLVLVNTSPTNLVFSASAGNLTLSWPEDHTGWTLQAQTNSLSVGISTNWVDVPNSSSTNQMVIPINSGNGSVFYRLIYP